MRKAVLGILSAIGLSGVAALALYAYTLPLTRRLPQPGHTSMDGIVTTDDAVDACRHSGLTGWELAAFAQNLVARKMRYSRLNPWDSPARAFTRGMGYCLQQSLALKAVYDQLGVPSTVVFATRCKFPPAVIDGVWTPERVGGHAWLRVRLGDTELDVDPGSKRNTPGNTRFELLSPVRTLRPAMLPFIRLGDIIENARRDRRARATSVTEPENGFKTSPRGNYH